MNTHRDTHRENAMSQWRQRLEMQLQAKECQGLPGYLKLRERQGTGLPLEPIPDPKLREEKFC